MAPQHLQDCLLYRWWPFRKHKLQVVFQLLSPQVHKQLWLGFSFALSSWHSTPTATLLYELLPHGSFSGLSLEMVRSVASSSGTPFPSLLKVEDVLASFPKPLASQPMHAPVPLVNSIMMQHAPDNLPMPFTQYQQIEYSHSFGPAVSSVSSVCTRSIPSSHSAKCARPSPSTTKDHDEAAVLKAIPDGRSVSFSVRAEMPNGGYYEVKSDADVLELVKIFKEQGRAMLLEVYGVNVGDATLDRYTINGYDSSMIGRPPPSLLCEYGWRIWFGSSSQRTRSRLGDSGPLLNAEGSGLGDYGDGMLPSKQGACLGDSGALLNTEETRA
ncbi:hypothetical protein NE237_017697 [Protea cynaroides]|uniref:Uncharacterized protein n=1 Tax=Protea cynaroides TaxID=273540 RepID=A0A9Q0QNB2_9MAGN|nr:hypothetical protein NE237_017697 [Protea cynaroides]